MNAIFCTWKCKFATASTLGKIQVDIIKANIWTAIKSTVQTANVTRRGVGICNNEQDNQLIGSVRHIALILATTTNLFTDIDFHHSNHRES